MQWVAGPRYVGSSASAYGGGTDGNTYRFMYDAASTSGRLTSITDYSLDNFVPNDGTATAQVKMCAGIYDQNWNGQYSCTQASLAPGVVTPVAVAYALPPGTTGLMTNWFFAPAAGGASFAVDDAYLGYAPN